MEVEVDKLTTLRKLRRNLQDDTDFAHREVFRLNNSENFGRTATGRRAARRTATGSSELHVILGRIDVLCDNLHLHPQVVSDPTWKNYGMRIPKSSNSQYDTFGSVSAILSSLGEILGTGIDEYKDMVVNSAMTSIDNINNSDGALSYYDAPMEQPFFKTRSIETDITIANGATVVMGGLITEERKSMEDKIPYLGDLPWIGRFFRSRSEWSNKRNLLIFVTARLVDPMGRQISMGVTESAEAPEAKVTPAPEG